MGYSPRGDVEPMAWPILRPPPAIRADMAGGQWPRPSGVESPTFGVRRSLMERSKLDRTEAAVETRFGRIRLKIGLLDGDALKATPEYEDCRAAAEAHGVPLAKVVEAARDAWKKGGRKSRRKADI